MASEQIKQFNPLSMKIDPTKNVSVFVIAVGSKDANGTPIRIVPGHLRAAQEAAKSVLEAENLNPLVASQSYEIPEVALNENESLRLDVECAVTVGSGR